MSHKKFMQSETLRKKYMKTMGPLFFIKTRMIPCVHARDFSL